MLVGFEKSLLRYIGIGPVKGVAGRHAPHREELQCAQLAPQPGHGLEPVNLAFLPLRIALRNENLAPGQAQFPFPLRNIPPDGWLAEQLLGIFRSQPCPVPVRRMPLLARRLQIKLQYLLDLIFERP